MIARMQNVLLLESHTLVNAMMAIYMLTAPTAKVYVILNLNEDVFFICLLLIIIPLCCLFIDMSIYHKPLFLIPGNCRDWIQTYF